MEVGEGDGRELPTSTSKPAAAPASRIILRIGWGQSINSQAPSASRARQEE
jgi:hypothetical protein